MKTVLPKDPEQGRYQDQEHHYVDAVAAVRIDDLADWCRANPEVPAIQLLSSIERGDFG